MFDPCADAFKPEPRCSCRGHSRSVGYDVVEESAWNVQNMRQTLLNAHMFLWDWDDLYTSHAVLQYNRKKAKIAWKEVTKITRVRQHPSEKNNNVTFVEIKDIRFALPRTECNLLSKKGLLESASRSKSISWRLCLQEKPTKANYIQLKFQKYRIDH